ncbi:PLP-dependent transferase, partial [Gloeophyllum trabeum ATCC 11539]
DAARQRLSAYFLGPKAENLDYMLKFLHAMIEDMRRSRMRFGPSDKVSIDSSTRASEPFENAMVEFEALFRRISVFISEHSVPIYSPRYMAHMVSENSLPGTLGYMLGLLYNQNNVALEVSPVTTLLEWEVGQQLCALMGFRRHPRRAEDDSSPDNANEPYGWGHITCDGSVANLESIWYLTRNLKFYPLSLRNAMTKPRIKAHDDQEVEMPPPLAFAYGTFQVCTCTGQTKLFKDCTIWELLNLTPDTVLGLPIQLSCQFGVSSAFVEEAMQDYDVQSVGKDELVHQHGLSQPVYFISKARHYSWPKGAAVTGIGSSNLIGVKVDLAIRLDVADLRRRLDDCLTGQIPVYCVVAIIGTTEHGAVDPLSEIVQLRQEFQRKGLSFLIHADAAWGGYFATLKRPAAQGVGLSHRHLPIPLHNHTNQQLCALKFADSITVDPHKAGYVPYPAGGLCYRDERLKFLVSWTSPYLDGQQNAVDRMGTYGIEGSKPGAAAVAAFLSHEVLGLNAKDSGYQTLLSEALYTSAKLHCHWATIDTGVDGIITTSLQMLPAEKDGSDVEAQKDFIRLKILGRADSDILQDKEAHEFLSHVGSDLMINTFACNFRVGNVLNEDLEEANYLNRRIFEEMSIMKVTDEPSDKEAIIMATSLPQDTYGDCASVWKRRMGLKGNEDLYALGNICMSPFSNASNIVTEAVRYFNEVALRDCRWRSMVTPDVHSFLLQGIDPIYLSYLPTLQAANGRNQIILQVHMPSAATNRYLEARSQPSAQFFTITTAESLTLDSIACDGASFQAVMHAGHPEPDHKQACGCRSFTVSVLRVVRCFSIAKKCPAQDYPLGIPFFLYGCHAAAHLEHILTHAPDAHICASEVQLHFGDRQSVVEEGLEAGWVAVMEHLPEPVIRQPGCTWPPALFYPDTQPRKFKIAVHEDNTRNYCSPLQASCALGDKIAEGSITLGRRVYVDNHFLNVDPID